MQIMVGCSGFFFFFFFFIIIHRRPFTTGFPYGAIGKFVLGVILIREPFGNVFELGKFAMSGREV